MLILTGYAVFLIKYHHNAVISPKTINLNISGWTAVVCHRALFLNPLKAVPLDIAEHLEQMIFCGHGIQITLLADIRGPKLFLVPKKQCILLHA